MNRFDSRATPETLSIVLKGYHITYTTRTPKEGKNEEYVAAYFLREGYKIINSWLSPTSSSGKHSSEILSNVTMNYLVEEGEKVSPSAEKDKETLGKAIEIAKDWLETYQWTPMRNKLIYHNN